MRPAHPWPNPMSRAANDPSPEIAIACQRFHRLGSSIPPMTITRSPRRHLPELESTITRLEPSSSRTVISRLADLSGVRFRFSATGLPAAMIGMASPCPISRVDSMKPHSPHLILWRASPLAGNVAASIAAIGFADSTEETGRMSREAPIGNGIHAVNAANPAALDSVTVVVPIHGSREGHLSACVCTEESCRSPKAPSVRWRA